MNPRIPLFAALASLLAAAPAPADPSLTASLRPDRSVYYVGERADFDLSLDVGSDELLSETLSPSGLPDQEGVVRLGRLQPVGAGAPGRFRWTAPLDFLAPGEVSFAPALRGSLRRLRASNGFFRQYEEIPLRATAPARVLTVREPPEEGRPDGFFGAVGVFTLEAAFSQEEASPGDPVTLRWTLRGRGADLAAGAPPAYSPGPDFRTYSPRVESRTPGELTVTQVVVPLSESASASPRFAVPVFLPTAGAYVECAAPPLSLRVVPRPAPATAPDAAARERAAAGSDPRPGERVRALRTAPARLAPADTALRLFDLPAGSDVLVRERHGSWARVLLPDGASGWLPASLLSPASR